jgi:putative aldouronate transport system substrate-binding protein
LAINKASKNPEQALKFIQESYTNSDVQNLLAWGIEGVHWQWKDKSKKIIAFVDGKTVENTGYYPNASDQFRTTINKLSYYRSEGDLLTDQRVADSIKSNSVVSPIFGFVPDMASVKTAMANVANVAAQYGDPLEKGLVDPQDPKIGLAVFRAKLKEAGIDTILAELQKQINAWKAENKK